MPRTPLASHQQQRIENGLPFVESLARRVAATMPHSIDIGDLVQNGMLGLIDAARRFDECRGIKFETFAERRVRGAMIDALRRDAWPRGVRRIRRELEAAREALRRELGAEPTLADLAARVGSDEVRLGKTIVRIHTIESTSPLASGEGINGALLPPVLAPSEPVSPDRVYEQQEVRNRIRTAIASLPPRERRVVWLYYFGDVTMKEIGAEIGVNESRVSQLHARAIQRLRKVLCDDAEPETSASRPAVLAFEQMLRRMKMAKAVLDHAADRGRVRSPADAPAPSRGVVLSYTRRRSAGVRPASMRRVASLKRPARRRLAAAR